MKILFAASEIVPFASTGGLADVAGSLPEALARLGLTVYRVMPMYRPVVEKAASLENLGLKLDIPVGFRSYRADVWKTTRNGVETFFIRRDEFFDRSQLYNLPDRDYDDNFERFVFFQKAVVALIDALGLSPDIVHGNDWQCGLIPMFLTHGIRGVGRNRREKFVFTIHNLTFQGIYSGNDFSLTNLPFNAFSVETMEFYNNINCLKNGITCADRVTTVSATYAREIQSESLGLGLHGVLSAANSKLVGIPNGIDVETWNPKRDTKVAATFTAENLAGKAACRADLLKAFGMSSKPGVPVIGMVSRLTEDKGFDLLGEAITEVVKSDAVLLILGRGDTAHEKACREWAQTWPDHIACSISYDEPLGRKVIAGSDILLMPSKVEPCGLSQLKAMRYGTVPVVHGVGGLADTVTDADIDREAGFGFVYGRHDAGQLVATLQRAIDRFADKAAWSELVRRAMSIDVSWDVAAKRYANVYSAATGRTL